MHAENADNCPITLSDYNFADELEQNAAVYAPITFEEIVIVMMNHNIDVKEEAFPERELKKHCATHLRAQRCLDSYRHRQRQISQSDCEISSNCGN